MVEIVFENNGMAKSAKLKNLAMIKPSERTQEIICVLSIIIVSGMWAFLTFDKLAVSSEGWYVVYADMIIAGKTPYLDFELVFPPLYTYLIYVLTLVFGEGLIVFRVVGIFVFIGIALVAYSIFKLIFPRWIAAIAAIVAIFIMQSESPFIAYDYVRFYDLFEYVAFFLFLRLIIKSYKKEHIDKKLNLFFVGIACALAFLFRQTSGLIVFVYFIIFLIIIILFLKNLDMKRKDLAYMSLGFAIPVFITIILITWAGALTPFIQMVFLSGSKGSMFSMLFNWIPGTIMHNVTVTILSTAITLFFVFIFKKKIVDEPPDIRMYDYMMYSIFAILTAISIVILFYSSSLSSTMSSFWYSLLIPIFIFNFLLGLTIMLGVIIKIRDKEKVSLLEITYLCFCGFIFVVGFGAGTSSGLSLGEGALSFGFVLAIVLYQINRITKIKLKAGLKVATTVLAMMLVITPVSLKVTNPYEWWGLEAEEYSEAKYETDIDYFKGIKLTENEKLVYENFVEQTKLYLGEEDQLYCYSQIAIFYVLAGKLPNVKAPICWPDVSRDQTLLEDLEFLKQNNPKMIMFADHGDFVLEEHEKMFRDGQVSGHREMYMWLLECRDGKNSNYTVIETYELHNYKMYLMLLN